MNARRALSNIRDPLLKIGQGSFTSLKVRLPAVSLFSTVFNS
jgi:hypothetical protein